uniref:Beta-defensin n=1 Tax=Spermophilus dauricus TaxID=99837 RepID=A0A8C9PHD4_SPEDA
SFMDKCWSTFGRCRENCKENEVFYILCKEEGKCCVDPNRYVTMKPITIDYRPKLNSASAVYIKSVGT